MRRPLARTLAVSVAAIFTLAPDFLAPRQDVAYGPDPTQKLDVCLPPDQTAAVPAVLMIHGGGWRSGSRSAQTNVCAFLARQGVAAIIADYRLSTGAPGTTWPAQFQDVQLALRWIRAHAAEYGIDPSRICAEGDSAGAHLALMLGVVPGIDKGDMQAFLPNVSPHATCVIAISAPSDLLEMAALKPQLVANLLGHQDAAVMQAEERDASPALRARPGGAVPTLLVHGLQDPAVPFSQATEMQAALQRSGAPAWLIAHPGGHGLNGLTGQQPRALLKLIAGFVKSPHLPGAPRQMTVEDAIGQAVP
jgi:acetyl esterase/lipase